MHNLALALAENGYQVTGSDDEIFDPAKMRLEKAGLLPETMGWNPEQITHETDAIILGMHARKDNPELLKAQSLGIKIYSYPEFLYKHTKNKTRVVIAGSHGKTTVTSMIMHVLKTTGINYDYMVGAQIEGFDTMVSLRQDTEIAVFEGDEYLSSPIDRRPKFLHYKPHIAVINGIAWDHINVFPDFEMYVDQFRILVESVKPGGVVYYNSDDTVLSDLMALIERKDISVEEFSMHAFENRNEETILKKDGKDTVQVSIFGEHNMRNISAAKKICLKLGVGENEFYDAISSFSGSAKRLQLLHEDKKNKVFLDFAHAPSKVHATVQAVRNKFPESELHCVLELHTFSSLNKQYLKDYKDTLEYADNAIVYFNPEVVKHKNLPEITIDDIKIAFQKKDLVITNSTDIFRTSLKSSDSTKKTKVYLFMSSGNFNGLTYNDLISFCY